jgi:hypothetical protein
MQKQIPCIILRGTKSKITPNDLEAKDVMGFEYQCLSKPVGRTVWTAIVESRIEVHL